MVELESGPVVAVVCAASPVLAAAWSLGDPPEAIGPAASSHHSRGISSMHQPPVLRHVGSVTRHPTGPIFPLNKDEALHRVLLSAEVTLDLAGMCHYL